jgi:SAM-dependent methyltransferase
LALLRNFHDGPDAEAAERLEAIRRLLDDSDYGTSYTVSEIELAAGYQSWSRRYDEPGNPLIKLEEPAVRTLTSTAGRGMVLDAACGTGRHARHLAAAGHQVTGCDISAGMLDSARSLLPNVRFIEADLRRIPVVSNVFDLVLCGLALGHVADLREPVGELARVLRAGGRMIISVLHPFLVHVGWQPTFRDEQGSRRFVRDHAHSHADYIDSFREFGMVVRGCLEPELSKEAVLTNKRADAFPQGALAAFLGYPAVLIWDLEKS